MSKRAIAKLLLAASLTVGIGPIQCINEHQIALCEEGCADRGAALLWLVTTGNNNIDCWCTDWSAFPVSRGKVSEGMTFEEACAALESNAVRD